MLKFLSIVIALAQTILWPGFTPVVEPGGGHVMAQPFLGLGNGSLRLRCTLFLFIMVAIVVSDVVPVSEGFGQLGDVVFRFRQVTGSQ